MNPHSHKVIGAQVSAIAQENKRLREINSELLEALQSVEMALIGYTHQNYITRTALSKARAAIAKATE